MTVVRSCAICCSVCGPDDSAASRQHARYKWRPQAGQLDTLDQSHSSDDVRRHASLMLNIDSCNGKELTL